MQVEAAYRDPFVWNKAAENDNMRGGIIESCSEGGDNVCDLQNGEWLQLGNVDFGKGASAIEMRVASATRGGTGEIRLDSPNGPVVGTVGVKNTGGWQNWTTVRGKLSDVKGRHDVFVTFKGEDRGVLFNVYTWRFLQL
jgi:arabinoxylan arabinofuranohydrolase